MLSRAVRGNRLADRCAAERAVDLLLARLRRRPRRHGDLDERLRQGHPGGARSSRSRRRGGGARSPRERWCRTAIPTGSSRRAPAAGCATRSPGATSLGAGQFESVHGGFSTVHANADPHRILPLDVARELEAEGRIGRLHDDYLVTAGNGTHVDTAAGFGVEWAAELRRAGVQAAILTAT